MVRKVAASLAVAAGLAAPASAFVAPSAGAASGQPTASLRATAVQQAVQAPAAGNGLLAAAGVALAGMAAAGLGRRTVKERKAVSVVKLNAAVGDAIPNVGLDEGFPPEKVMLADYCKGKKVVLVGLPGAFTPT
eukprot:gb/GFBE01068430.1/.p1 GENE.gb/GFBE01068430.1/~~gb/GFBE01068430.1/.p1  ORF type:complete len:134 (+),score=35.23 gb/GFBE01068430.1/:1-402(+)